MDSLVFGMGIDGFIAVSAGEEVGRGGCAVKAC